MSFFVSCPITYALADPHKSGHQPTSRIIVKSTLHVCPDLWGSACASVIGHETKKDIPMLLKCSIFKLLPKLIEKLRYPYHALWGRHCTKELKWF